MANTPSGPDYGRALQGLGFNLLVNDFERAIVFATEVLGATIRFRTENFAAMRLAGQDYMYHAKETYRGNALYGTLAEDAPRGVGIELRCYEADPDASEAKARALGFTVLAGAMDKQNHGLRECVLLDEEGFAWVLSRRLEKTESSS